MILRVIFNILIIGSILFLPWWITVIVAVGFLSKFRAYEIMLWGIFADILYSASVVNFFNIESLFTITFILLFIASYFIKKQLRFYDI